MRLVTPLLLAFALLGCQHASDSVHAPDSVHTASAAPQAVLDTGTGRDVLMQADRDFAAEAGARGIDGWMSVMAPDAVRLVLGQPVITGLGAIREADAPLFTTDSLRLAWEPVDGGVFAGGDHGFTTGTYTLHQLMGDGTEAAVGQGSYITLWRREADGAWKVVLDGGASEPPPVPQPD